MDYEPSAIHHQLRTNESTKMLSRRKFLTIGLHSAVMLGAGNILQAFEIDKTGLPPKRKVKFRFAVASDGHYGQKETGFGEKHEEMIGWINQEFTGRGLDCSFINGDLYHDDISFAPATKQMWDRLTMPYYVSHGNHDHASEASWDQTWGQPWHYGFEQKNCAFIVLNTANETGKYICPDLEKTRQLLAQYQHHQHLFVFMHITPIKWTDNGIDCPELISLFSSQSNLKAVFHGHDHHEDNSKEKNGQHYFFDAHVAGNWGTSYRGYRIVEVMKNGDILTYQMNPSTQNHENSNLIL